MLGVDTRTPQGQVFAAGVANTMAQAQVRVAQEQIAALQPDLNRMRRLYRDALRSHNDTLAKTLKGHIEDLTNTITQSRIDEATGKQAIQQAIKDAADAVNAFIVKRIDDTTTYLQSLTTAAETQLTIVQTMQHLAGTDIQGFQKLKDKQGGTLTTDQIAQANAALQQYITSTRNVEQTMGAQIKADMATLANPGDIAAEAAKLGITPQQETQNLQNEIANLVAQILSLESGIKDQTDATKDLTTATTSLEQQFGGSVTYSYQGQSYVVGQTSDSTQTIGVGM
jgi:hypothetical protein